MSRIIIGMSGGVDSSVAALLLKEQGLECAGVFMYNWEEEDDSGVCCAQEDFDDVRRVCDKIGIPYYTVNFVKEYYERVFSYFLKEYEAGRTPNPDILCNKEIKFSAFLNFARQMGADKLATGHYARLEERDGLTALLRAKDENKDQTYFLNQVSTDQLRRVMFPLGRMLKPEVRRIAEQNGLVTAKKKDSTGICFIGERKFRAFLSEYLPGQKGRIVDVNGKTVGEHFGLMYYTLGQRKGLGIGGVAGEEQSRWYVVEKRLSDNALVVSCGEGEELFSRALNASGLNVIGPWDKKKFECTAKFRYRQSEQPVFAEITDNDRVRIEFKTPQRAVTPGQYAVLYCGERCLGGAVIDEVIK